MAKTKDAASTELQDFMRVALGTDPEPDPRPTPDGKPRLMGPPAAIVAFSDWNYYYTKDIVGWRSDTSPARTVSVPVGFVTDLASTPSLLWTFLPKTAQYSYPAIIHDYLYWFQPCDRKEADGVLKSAMEDLDVPAVKILAVYSGVRAGGDRAWEANAAARANGEKRILKDFPTDMKISWDQWKIRPGVFAPDA